MHAHDDHTGKGLLQLAEEFTDQAARVARTRSTLDLAEAARLAAVNRMDDRELADALEAVDFLTGPLPCAGRVCADADAVDAADLRARERAERFRAALHDRGTNRLLAAVEAAPRTEVWVGNELHNRRVGG